LCPHILWSLEPLRLKLKNQFIGGLGPEGQLKPYKPKITGKE
jgi:hypothetical protein